MRCSCWLITRARCWGVRRCDAGVWGLIDCCQRLPTKVGNYRVMASVRLVSTKVDTYQSGS